MEGLLSTGPTPSSFIRLNDFRFGIRIIGGIVFGEGRGGKKMGKG